MYPASRLVTTEAAGIDTLTEMPDLAALITDPDNDGMDVADVSVTNFDDDAPS